MGKLRKSIITYGTSVLVGAALFGAGSYAALEPGSPFMYTNEQALELHQRNVESEGAEQKANQAAAELVNEIVAAVGSESFTEQNANDFIKRFVKDRKDIYLAQIQETGEFKLPADEIEKWLANYIQQMERLRKTFPRVMAILGALMGLYFGAVINKHTDNQARISQ